MAEREQRRWMVALLGPLLTAFAALFATFATTGGPAWTNWFFVGAILLGPGWVVTLVFLALTSDTNAAGERVQALPVQSSKRLDREAA